MISYIYKNSLGKLYLGDAKEVLSGFKPQSLDVCVTSPPYWSMRKYNNSQELGQESTIKEYIENLCSIFDELYPVLKDSGSLWVVIGDTYYSKSKGTGGKTKKQLTNPGSFFAPVKYKENLQEKSLCNVPAKFLIAMEDRGWIFRNQIIWHKPNAFVTPTKDRFTVDFENVFWFTKMKKYYFNQQFEPFSDKTKWKFDRRNYDGVSEWDNGTGQVSHRARNMRPNEKGRNKRTVWSITIGRVHGIKHHAKFPEELIVTPINATCPPNGIVSDIFMGSGTTAVYCQKTNRKWLGIEINQDYCNTIIKRLKEMV